MAKINKNEVLLEAKGLYKTYTQMSGFFVKNKESSKRSIMSVYRLKKEKR